MCVDEQFRKLYKTYFGEDALENVLNDMIKESKYCFKVFETELNKPLAMTKKDH